MEAHLNQEQSSSTDAELQTKLLPDNHRGDHVRKGGLRTMPFIIVNVTFEGIASYGLMMNMIFYLIQVYHMEAVTASTVYYIWSALFHGLSVFGGFIADAYLGRFRVISIGSFVGFLGMSFLWMTTMVPQLTPSASSCQEASTRCSPPTLTQLGFLFASLGLISIGTGCIRPCSLAFGADQLKHHNNQRLIDSYFNWYFASFAFSAIIASTVVVYIQDHFGWQIGFVVPVFVIFCAALVFVLGSPLYVKVKVNESPFSGFGQVLINAFRNRKIHLLPAKCYNHSNDMDRLEPTDNLRFLNKACVVRDASIGSSSPNSCSDPTVEKVESLKSLIQIIPIWSSGILVYTIILQSFPILQAEKMNRNIVSWFQIPAASFNLFMRLTVTIWIPFYDRILVPFLAKFTHEPHGINPKTRMGVGLIFLIMAMVVSAIVETVRRDLANSNPSVDMSAMWLVPQYALLGLTEAFSGIGQLEFYYSELPKSMSSFAMAAFMVSSAIASLIASLLANIVDSVTGQGGNVSWLSSDINYGHGDYYYWLICFLCLLNFFYYLICCRVHRSFSSESRLSHVVDEEVSGSNEDKL
ncbi:protein NRT1/ PTR FAMILY 1.2-like [Bidens hawaiensis]|uniref:protein NRT1/ PTR FAMILY 1.2-like n=1 Tax=Bidens hawaiensis TaxID=980011 RepID=UPI00404ABAC2